MPVKSSTLVTATKKAGACADCRHANHGTIDFGEGRLFCWIVKQPKKATQSCDVTLSLPRDTTGKHFSDYFLFERRTDNNKTFDVAEDLRILAEDADDDLRRSLDADRPFIPAD